MLKPKALILLFVMLLSITVIKSVFSETYTELTDNNYESEVLEFKEPLIAFFYADYSRQKITCRVLKGHSRKTSGCTISSFWRDRREGVRVYCLSS